MLLSEEFPSHLVCLILGSSSLLSITDKMSLEEIPDFFSNDDWETHLTVTESTCIVPPLRCLLLFKAEGRRRIIEFIYLFFLSN